MSHLVKVAFLPLLLLLCQTASTYASEFFGIAGSESNSLASRAFAVSFDGNAIAGTLEMPNGLHGFLWTNADGVRILEGVSQGFGISEDGLVVVGEGRNPNSNVLEPVRWTAAGGVQLLGGPAGVSLDFPTTAMDASIDGSVIVGQTISTVNRAFRWTSVGGVAVLEGLGSTADQSGATAVSDDGNVVVGVWQRSGMPGVGFRWTTADGVTPLQNSLELAGSGSSTATGISADGTIIIGEASSATGPQAFRWSEATGMLPLESPNPALNLGGFSTAYGVSQSGDAIVGVIGNRAFVWTDGNGMELLTSVLSERFGLGAALNGWNLEEARDISPDGRTIIGFGKNPNGQTQAWRVHLDAPIFVPEPAACFIIACALVLLPACRFRTH